MVSFSMYRETVLILFSFIKVVPIYIPTSNASEFQLLHIFTNKLILSLFNFRHFGMLLEFPFVFFFLKLRKFPHYAYLVKNFYHEWTLDFAKCLFCMY